jgi:DNA-binding transcriptional LysR family regulator
MLSLKLLEAFYWVVRLRGFHAAAARLNVTQPSISYRVKELEERLGRTLLMRGSQPFRLTSHGQALFIHAERMIGAAQDLQQQFRTGGRLGGIMRLGVTDAFAAICLPRLLSLMADEQPGLDVSVVVDNSYALTRKLDDGELDVAVVSTPPVLAGLRYEALGQQLVGWVAGPRQGGQKPEDADWVAASRIFVTPPPSNLDVITTGWFQSVGMAPPRFSVCNSMAAIVGLIRAGSGIGILPLPLVAGSLASGEMRRLDVAGSIPPQAILTAYNRGALDAAVPCTLEAVRLVVHEHGFCGAVGGASSDAPPPAAPLKSPPVAPAAPPPRRRPKR